MTSAILTCSEHFTDHALNEIRRHQPQVQFNQQLSPKHHLIHAPCSFSKLTLPWRHRLPIYLHHMFPVQHQIPIGDHLDTFCHQIRSRFLEFDRVQVRVVGESPHRAFCIRQALCPHPRKKKHDTKVLSLLVADRCGYMGVSSIQHNLSPYTSGRPYFAEGVPNRAGLKLLEALTVFGIRPPKNTHVLDLGAAPGAWTTVLRRYGLRVTAVAPAELYLWLQEDTQVDHYCCTAEAYIQQCASPFDMIVNDMIMDAQDSARLMVDYATHLRSNGVGIMTLKLRPHNTRRVMDHSFRILRKAYKIIQVRQLVSNKKEVTLFLRKK